MKKNKRTDVELELEPSVVELLDRWEKEFGVDRDEIASFSIIHYAFEREVGVLFEEPDKIKKLELLKSNETLLKKMLRFMQCSRKEIIKQIDKEKEKDKDGNIQNNNKI
jgi:hypothetical protein